MKNNNVLVKVGYLALLASVTFTSPVNAQATRSRTPNRPMNTVRSATPPETSTSYVPSEENGSSNYSPNNTNENIWDERLFYIFGGIDLGMSTYSAFDNITPGGTSRSGFHGGLRGLGAFYFKKWVLDGGFGWHYISNSGTDPTNGGKVSVTTRGSYVEVSPRYRLTRNWQLGPVFDYWFTTDNGLNPNALIDVPNNTSAWLGAQLLYEWMSDSWKYRLGGRWETSLGVTGRNVNLFQLFFQIGFPIFGNNDNGEEPLPRATPRPVEQLNESDVNRAAMYADPMPTPEATPWPSPEPVAEQPIPITDLEPEPTPVLQHKAQEKFVVTLDVNRLPFETDSARLPKYHRDRLKEIGRFLGEHKSQWRALSVSGHTDERGSNQYNDNLSKARAQTVRQLLLEGGAPAKRVKAIGYGERKPRDKRHNAKAWAKNRRVEFEFRGVKDVVIINDGMTINPQGN